MATTATTTAAANAAAMNSPIPKKDNQKPQKVFSSGLEEKVTRYKKQAIDDISISSFVKPASISFVALLLSFFLDLSYVPVLGNVSVRAARYLFPTWQPAAETIAPYSFWWLPVIVYFLFIWFAYAAFLKLKKDVIRTPSTETIDKILTSYTSVIDGIATALPLIGAALLLISISLGEEVFLGLSVPFEIKALIVLALGKLFEPVLDQLGLEFQNVVNNVQNMKERYYSRLQVRSSRDIVKHLANTSGNGNGHKTTQITDVSAKDLAQYNEVLKQTSQISESIAKNFAVVSAALEKMNNNQNFSKERIEQLKTVADSMVKAANSLSDEKTVAGLKALESIVRK
jgi:methyl-accepting chemotaxis protein